LDEQELLKSSGWPKWEEVLNRIMMQRQQMAAAQGMGGMPPDAMNAEDMIPETVEEVTGPLQEEQGPPVGLPM
jgi:hypothetical protein